MKIERTGPQTWIYRMNGRALVVCGMSREVWDDETGETLVSGLSLPALMRFAESTLHCAL